MPKFDHNAVIGKKYQRGLLPYGGSVGASDGCIASAISEDEHRKSMKRLIKLEVNRALVIVIEKGDNNYSAYASTYPGCISTGKTVDETIKNMKDAIIFHKEGLLNDQSIRGAEDNPPDF